MLCPGGGTLGSRFASRHLNGEIRAYYVPGKTTGCLWASAWLLGWSVRGEAEESSGPVFHQRGERLWKDRGYEADSALPGCHEPETRRHAAGETYHPAAVWLP